MIGFNNLGRDFIFGYVKDVKPLPPENNKQLLQDISMLKWFTSMNQSTFTIDEYPNN